jgi:hypothetical protein
MANIKDDSFVERKKNIGFRPYFLSTWVVGFTLKDSRKFLSFSFQFLYFLLLHKMQMGFPIKTTHKKHHLYASETFRAFIKSQDFASDLDIPFRSRSKGSGRAFPLRFAFLIPCKQQERQGH